MAGLPEKQVIVETEGNKHETAFAWGVSADDTATVTANLFVKLSALTRALGSRKLSTDSKSQVTAGREAMAKAAIFVLQCTFVMFLNSVGALGTGGFLRFLEAYRDRPQHFPAAFAAVFAQLEANGCSPEFWQNSPWLHGGFFNSAILLHMEHRDIQTLIEAVKYDWSVVEPDLFGQLLEDSADPVERAEFGMHFTAKTLVETVVSATIIEPLRQEWAGVEAAALEAEDRGDPRTARKLVRRFHRQLCEIKVMDPACGTGNFLYVALGLMRALESEVLATFEEVGGDGFDRWSRSRVSASQFIGLEKHRPTANVARMVMTIGDIQSFARSGRSVSSVLEWPGADIRVQDALLNCDPLGPVEALRRRELRPQSWPQVHFIVGNPPFLGAKNQRGVLGDDYVDSLNAAREGRFRGADLAACWWDRAARTLARDGSRLRRFGFITPGTITQKGSREVLDHHLNGDRPMRVVLAMPDLPWRGGANAASVRVSVTVVERGPANGQGRVLTVKATPGQEAAGRLSFTEQRGDIAADLTIGLDIRRASPLKANAGLASRGVQVVGAGFVVASMEAARLATLSAPNHPLPLRSYRNGRDLADRPRDVKVIDFFGLSEAQARDLHPGFHRHLRETVKIERVVNGRPRYRRDWWIFGEPRIGLRRALRGLSRYIVTVEIGKHRWFRFLDTTVVPDNRLVCIASDDPFILGVLSSRVHRLWAAATGGRLEDRPIYAKSTCFDRFPFPDATDEQRSAIGELAEDLDRTRTEVIEQWPDMSMTALYNARERNGDGPARDLSWRYRSRIDVVDRLHARIDALVLAAYGWPAGLTDTELLARLVVLNGKRRAEEDGGRIAWLRPEFQARSIHRSGSVGSALSLSDTQDGESVLAVMDQGLLRRDLFGAAPAAGADEQDALTFRGCARRSSQIPGQGETWPLPGPTSLSSAQDTTDWFAPSTWRERG
jgi:hypothetical protein